MQSLSIFQWINDFSKVIEYMININLIKFLLTKNKYEGLKIKIKTIYNYLQVKYLQVLQKIKYLDKSNQTCIGFVC